MSAEECETLSLGLALGHFCRRWQGCCGERPAPWSHPQRDEHSLSGLHGTDAGGSQGQV